MVGTPEQIKLICAQLSEGKSLRQIAREMEMAESTLRYWLVRDPDAFAQTAHARELGCDALADECIEIADDKSIDPADRRIRIETRLKLIGKWSQRYGDKLTVDSRQTVKHSYDFSKLEANDLDQLERIVESARSVGGDTGGAGKEETGSLH